MPLYEFKCHQCNQIYSDITTYDKDNIYLEVVCPHCGGQEKDKLISQFAISGPTSSKMDSFSYRAGYNMDKAQGERRQAEELSHMGTNPYDSGEFGKAPDDLASGKEGVDIYAGKE